jgi:dimethylargininase
MLWHMPIALTRAVSPAMAGCELTHLARTPIDVALAERQHEAYEAALRSCGWDVVRVPPAPDRPDAVFVEDTLVVVDELAIATRPGAASRRAEVAAVAETVARWRPLAEIGAPGTLDGGDVLRVGRRIVVGRSGRTNEDGIAQLAALLTPFGYTVTGVDVRGCLHLKSAVTAPATGVLLVNPAWIDVAALGLPDCTVLEVDPGEPSAANALDAGGTVIASAAFPRTRARLERAGLKVVALDMSETAKAEGAVTCCSVLVQPCCTQP